MCLRNSILYTGQKKEEVSSLISKSIHSAILDGGHSSTVAGGQWITCDLDSLSPDELAEVKREPSDIDFKFAGENQISHQRR